MRKKMFLIISLVLGVLVLYNATKRCISTPTDFKIQQHFVAKAEEFTDVRLHVVACINNYDTQKMTHKVKRYYNLMYGSVERLQIILFDSIEDFKIHKECSKETFYKCVNN